MAAPCGFPLGLCALRLTKLEATGAVSSVTGNSFVTTSLISLQLTPVVDAGADITLTGGCDCVLTSYRGVDKLKRFDFTITNPQLSPAMYQMMLGGTLINSGADPVGETWPVALSCGETQPSVAMEFWVKHWTADGAQDAVYPWIHHVYPQTLWQIGQQQFQNDFAQPTLTGFSRGNSAWGDGPYGDGPFAEYGVPVNISTGGYFYTATDPPADTACATTHVVPGT